jgi:uncharacterized protein YjdB
MLGVGKFIRQTVLLFGVAVIASLSACGGSDDGGVAPETPKTQDTKTVTPGGAPAQLLGGATQGGVTVTVPAAAASGSVQVTVDKQDGGGQVSDGNRQGSVYLLGPDGTQFNAPVEVRIAYPSGFSGDPSELLLFTKDAQGNPEPLQQQQVASGQFVAGQTMHFSPFWASASGRTPTTLDVVPTSATLTSGSSVNLTTVVRNPVGSFLPTASVSYSSADASIASVTSAGVVTGHLVGSTSVTAQAGSASVAVAVTVTAGSLSTVVVAPGADTIIVGGTAQFTALGRDIGGNDLGSQTASWRSSDPSIASVDASGLATGHLPGDVTLTGRVSGVSGTATLTVTPDATAGADSVLVVTPDSVSVVSGSSSRLVASVVRSDGGSSVLSAVTWTSRDSTVASIDADGSVTGSKVGTTYAVASAAGLDPDSARVTVRAGAPASIVIDPDSVEVPAGAEEELSATVTDANGNVVDAVLSWTSDNTAVATVNQEGIVQAGDLGTAIITAATPRGVSGSAKVVVSSGDPTGFRFVPDPVEVRAGQTLAVQVNPTDAKGRTTRLPDSLSLTLVSRDTSVAKVDVDANVSGFGIGATYLVATAGSLIDSVQVNTVPGLAASAQFVSPSSDTTVAAGDTIAVTVQGIDVLGNVFQNTGVVLTSDDGAVVATLGGMAIQGRATGTAKVTATVDAISVSLNVTVQPGSASSLVMTEPSADTTMAAGGLVKLMAEVRDAFGNVRGDAVGFATSDASKIRISGDTAYAEKTGDATVTATSGALQAQRAFSVTHGTAASIAFTTPVSDTVELGAGDQLQTTAEATDAFGNNFADGITFRSGNAGVATVDAAGLVSGVSLGEAFIYAEINPTDSILVKVVPGALSAVAVTPSADTANAVGDTLTFTAAATDNLGNSVAGVTFNWVLLNGSVGQLLETTGTAVRFVSAGNGSSGLVATGTKGGVNRADTANVVVAIQVADVLVAPAADSASSIGETAQFAATAKDANGNVINGVTFAWTSTDGGVGTVDASGLATAVANGSTKIIATADAKADTATFVVAQVATSLVVTPSAATLTAFGATQATTTTVTDANGNPVAGAAVAWSTTAAGVATVSPTGLITAVANGSAKIIATSGGLADTVDVTVSQTPNSVVVTPAAATLTAIGAKQTYRVVVQDAQGAAIFDAALAWSVTDVAVATLQSAGDSTVATAVGNGTASVVVQATRGGQSMADTAAVMVTVQPASVVISPDTATLSAAGASVDLSGRVTVKDASNNTIQGASVSWTSLNTAVATVTAVGVVTAVANGSAGIVATSGSVSDTATVTVNIVASRVVISPVADTMAVGGSVQFSATTFDSNGNQISAGVAWSSSAVGVATVNGSGLAAGVGAGVTSIIATSGAAADTAQLGVAGANSIVSTAFANGSAQATVAAGAQVTIPVTFDMGRVSANGDLGSLALEVSYDSSLFTLVSATSSIAGSPDVNTGTVGKVTFGYINANPLNMSEFDLLTVVLTAKSGVPQGSIGKIGLAFTNDVTSTINGGVVTYQPPVAVAGEIVIGK